MSEVELNELPTAGGYSVTLPMFEGPLDLLLHLCQKHELDILDIPIGFVTEKYLEYLAVMQLMNLDVASEYLVMAATLAHIKSKMLLPAPPPGQEDEVAGEEEDPRESLIRRLLEYQKYKQAGEDLAGRGVAGRDVFMRGMPIENAVHTGLPPLAQVPLFSLVEAFQNVLSKSKVKLSHDIVHERVTLADRINELVDLLRVHRRMAFEDLFADMKTRFDLVITFLALLEMTRLRMTRLFQADFDSQIFIEFTAQVTVDDEAEAESDQDSTSDTSDSETSDRATLDGASSDRITLDRAVSDGITFDDAVGGEWRASGALTSSDHEGTPANGLDELNVTPRFDTDRPPAEITMTDETSTPSFDTDPPRADEPEPLDLAQEPDELLEETAARTYTVPCPPPDDSVPADAGAVPRAEDILFEAVDGSDAVVNVGDDTYTNEEATEPARVRAKDEDT